MRKIADVPIEPGCSHPEHDPPKNMKLLPGVYAHICPGCGSLEHIVIPRPPRLIQR